ncbi:McrC family protein [Robertmurraya andreesenii]|uniref:5-methylcytosine-specific restriction enzyme subunit McrC n=1 Tax=Anoxybacillus andreesenii TaxID=1325932 RepID=A0ABT9V163_9BACL|nr:McrC family protein [Robertmurraya andreesenii]MDQ0154692.1 5-methylcytosine-specific restriction enzyme subunit McrC [Robertmurraya andreesenii]
MDKRLEVREFESITCNEDYKDKDDPHYKYLNQKTFEELESFILAFSEHEQAEAMDFLKISVRRHVGKVIQARNYVGLIQMKNGFQIQILPKVSSSEVEDTKKTFLQMLRSMKDFPSKVFNEAHLKIDKMNLYEIFINMYIQEVRNLMKKGLRSVYLPVQDNLNYYKGKLNVGEHIKRNLIHKERFYVGYDEFDINRPENRLIKSTLLKLQKLSSSTANLKEIRQLLLHFEMVKPSSNYTRDFSLVVIDRNTEDYEALMQWSKVFLLNQSFTTFSGNTTARALLFPMEKVFEAYVAKHLKQALADLPWEVSTQDRGYYLIDQPKKFALRPDIVITRHGQSPIVLDTKWKSLTNQPRKNYGISQADMYQMYAYSKKYNTKEIWLLYPVNEEMKDLDIRFESLQDDAIETQVRLFFVDVANIEESLAVLKERLSGY